MSDQNQFSLLCIFIQQRVMFQTGYRWFADDCLHSADVA